MALSEQITEGSYISENGTVCNVKVIESFVQLLSEDSTISAVISYENVESSENVRFSIINTVTGGFIELKGFVHTKRESFEFNTKETITGGYLLLNKEKNLFTKL
jgi:hypothetical protein